MIVICHTAKTDQPYESIDPFDRASDVGLINVNNVTSPQEMRKLYPYQPPKVKDLKVIGMSYENETVTFQWTALGDYEEQETGRSDVMLF